MRISTSVLTLAFLSPLLAEGEQSYRVYTDHPRLWLDARRLRLLKRERDRDSVRWQQLQLLVKRKQPLPEEPLVKALEYQVAADQDAGKQAVQWALQRAEAAAAPSPTDLRLLAVVFDWCYPSLEEGARAKLVQSMSRGVGAAAAAPGLRPFTNAVLAAITLADDWAGSEQALTVAFEKRWPREFLPALRENRGFDAPAEWTALLELCHAARDNLNLDLWGQAPAFFRQFPFYLLLQYYPAPVTIDGHRFRQPARLSTAKSEAAVDGELARVAEMQTAAYETNSVETQFLQGWITHDVYRLRTPSGTVYEFLWMNPYQPGLSYYAVPLQLYDETGGILLARSSWDDDAAWVGYLRGELQLFADGERTVVGAGSQPIVFPQLAVVRASGDVSFRVRLVDGNDVFVVGLESARTYWVKAGGAKFAPRVPAKGGILHLKADAGEDTAFEIKTADPNPPPPTLDRKKRK